MIQHELPCGYCVGFYPRGAEARLRCVKVLLRVSSGVSYCGTIGIEGKTL